MSKARLSDQAKEDLVGIWEYIAQENLTAADRLVQKLVTQYTSLAENPGMGRLREELRLGLRSFPVGSYLILYQPIPEGIAVFRIIHGARDFERLLEREADETFRFEEEEGDA
jgi:toxin ParE1/3/4